MTIKQDSDTKGKLDIAPEKRPGHEIISDYVKRLETSPGVYRMLDLKGEVLYVGKARNLKKRVSSYARMTGHSNRIARMIASTASMMFLTTETETEALLLEQNLIKQLKPRYNVLLRDDKSFPDILVTNEHDFPAIEKHRGKRSRQGQYFGPFASAGAVNRTLYQLHRVFQLRNCSDSVFASRTRPCLQYQIKRCLGPCVGLVSKEDYKAQVQNAVDFLSGKSSELQARLAREMQAASDELNFEKAAAIRDRIRALSSVMAKQDINPETVKEADIIALHMEGGHACVQVFFIRAGQNWGNSAFYPKTGAGAEKPEVLEAFLMQFYQKKQPPSLLLLSDPVEDGDLIQSALSKIREGKPVHVHVPKRGEKLRLVNHALRNARESLARKLSETVAHQDLLEQLSEKLKLQKTPERIEVYDNSHIQGEHSIGAMIVVGPEGFMKSHYRKYNIKQPETKAGDDFGMMREVLGRRFKRLLKEDPERENNMWPDLLLIDGGAGQVSSVHMILSELEIEGVEIVGVAKGTERDAGKERFYKPGQPSFALPFRDPALYFIQRIRDEAHRFAIGTHRQKRQSEAFKNPLDGVPGIGAKRKKMLLAYFGSAKAVSQAKLSDLLAVDGISDRMAETIYNYFQND